MSNETPIYPFFASTRELLEAKRWAIYGYRLRINNRMLTEEEIEKEVEKEFFGVNPEVVKQ